MGNGVDQWRVSIGLFDSRVCVCRQRVKVSFSWNFTFQYFVFLLSGFNHAVRLMSTSLKDLVNNLDFKLLFLSLIFRGRGRRDESGSKYNRTFTLNYS